MAKFFGRVGFSKLVEDPEGVWSDVIVAREYYGDIIRVGRRWEKGEGLNDDLQINNYLSILADSFIMENYQGMKWVEVSGAKWKVSSVEIEYPRIKITLGGVWNGS